MTAASPDESAPQFDAGLVFAGESGVSDPEGEELYKRACTALADQRAQCQPGGRTALLLLSMLFFAGAALYQTGFSLLALQAWLLPAVGVLLLHEAGHYVGMRLFDYRDLRMYFIPFFGAAVSGEKHATPAWQQAIVLLLGPLPGIVLGVFLAAFHPPWLTIPLALMLLVINGFNLLPVLPLDGGRLLQVLFFSRQPLWDSAFHVFSGVGLAVLGWLAGSWALGVLAVTLLVSVPFRYRVRQQRAARRRELPELPAQLDGLSEVHRRALFRCARLLAPNAGGGSDYAKEMKALHEETATKPVGVIPALALLSLYGAGAIVVLWSLSCFFYWGESENPSEWSQRRIEALLKGELKLNQIAIKDAGPGTYIGPGHTTEGTMWTLKVVQDKDTERLTWSAESEDGEKRVGRLRMSEGVLLDETPR